MGAEDSNGKVQPIVISQKSSPDKVNSSKQKEKKPLATCCRNFWDNTWYGRALKLLIKNLLFISLTFLYCVIGGIIFSYIEEKNEIEQCHYVSLIIYKRFLYFLIQNYNVLCYYYFLVEKDSL